MLTILFATAITATLINIGLDVRAIHHNMTDLRDTTHPRQHS